MLTECPLPSVLTAALSALLGVLTLLHLRRLWLQTRRITLQHYAPGPPPKSWLAGNHADVPEHKAWYAYTEWGKKYGMYRLLSLVFDADLAIGDVIHIRIYGRHYLILNSVVAATDLLEKRARIYSDRPPSLMLDIKGWLFATGFKPYGDSWRRHRRLLQQAFKLDSLVAYRPIQTRKVNDMLYGILTAPKEFTSFYKSVSAAIVMSVMYDYDLAPQNDRYVSHAEKAMAALSDPAFSSLVDIIPGFRYLPAWFPGASFRQEAAKIRAETDAMLEIAEQFVKKKMAEGHDLPCLMTDLMKYCKSQEDYDILKEAAATGYVAGADTTSSALGTFFYAMAAHPHVQKKAQEEIDLVVGSHRLPHWDDRPFMPYVEAVFREVIRWRAITPFGISHCTTDDDVYRGYYIPKGTIVVPNIWGMTRDEQTYKNPEVFEPERFLTEDGQLNNDNVGYTFGFGRRICVGRHLASSTFWYAMANVLATLDIAKKKDAMGNDLPLEVEYSFALVSHPLPFDCSVKPRSQHVAQTILDNQRAAAEML
ncbi:hypothetical protein NLJ89_g1809 [Agrocybe chaxingu]|uniref:Cytochrome P450 n=1 Tax=Agrocybe chaxingu TaxID=84603 RepID=A0A9W8MZC1_9AGAR|nr:hypothetical protein NLJ89_g1809 [Agrocybe chaxingu]